MAAGAVPIGLARAKSAAKPLNILLITADDLNCDSVGAYGCVVPGTTPNIDKLATQGVRFTKAHMTIAVCQPCRGVLATGRYPHRSGVEGFNHIDNDVPIVTEELKAAGYLRGILGKVGHCTPNLKYEWDMSYDMGQLGKGRDPKLYRQYAKAFMERARDAGKPFYLMANSHDPHRPFSASDQEKKSFKNAKVTPPSRTYKPGEVEVPGFLPDIPKVRLEIAEYYSSVRRSDDTVGAILRALDETGLASNTLVMFLSDHGMALPFAKTNCYLHSTHTPWIVRWPGVVEPGSVDKRHFISGIDFMPTALEAAGLTLPDGMDGVSFVPLLRGERQAGRDQVFTQFHETSGKNRFPMRCVQNERFGYIFNAWSDGVRVFKNESQSGRSFKAMQEAAKTDPEIAARVKFFQCRVVEELYDFKNDPDALRNLADDPKYKKPLERMRAEMADWMRRTGDYALVAFQDRSPEALAKFMADQQAKADLRKKKKTPKKNNPRQNNKQQRP